MKSQNEEQDVLDTETRTIELKSLKNPFARGGKSKGLTGGNTTANVYGLCSIQDFSQTLGTHAHDLSYTHADAQGFYNYLNNFYSANYWFMDSGVQSWGYEEPYDHWQNIYGVDAVLAFYHSGHGNMDANGVFSAPMGGKWGSETWIYSNNKMQLANQVSRYIFWSTCLSCRVTGGMSPVRTWWVDDNNPGFRMLFGFETTSVDSPNYGSNFWNHWRNNEAFSRAWLNASWDISHSQAPSCVASGSDSNDAISRLNTERLFNWGAVARNWYQWMWYIVSSSAERNKSLPKELKIAELETETFTRGHIHSIADALNIRPIVNVTKDGFYNVGNDEKIISLNSQGHLNVNLGTINYNNKVQFSEKEAIKIAEQYIEKYKLHAGENYQFDVVRLTKTAGSNTAKNAKIEKEYVTDTMVQYRQFINGVPVVNSDSGLIRVTIDNDGKVTNLHSSVKKTSLLHSNPKSNKLDPKNAKSMTKAKSASDVEKAFKKQLSKYKSVKLMEEEIGYDVKHSHGRIVNQRVYEISMGHGLKKRIKLMVAYYE